MVNGLYFSSFPATQGAFTLHIHTPMAQPSAAIWGSGHFELQTVGAGD